MTIKEAREKLSDIMHYCDVVRELAMRLGMYLDVLQEHHGERMFKIILPDEDDDLPF